MQYIYFVSYRYKKGEETYGVGMIEITRPEEINLFVELKQIADDIASYFTLESVAIVNYQLLRTEEE